MCKYTLAITVFLCWLSAASVFATETEDRIRQECEDEVKSLGITDAEEYRQAVSDCIESMMPPVPGEPIMDDNRSLGRT